MCRALELRMNSSRTHARLRPTTRAPARACLVHYYSQPHAESSDCKGADIMLAIPGGAVGISVLGRADIADDDAIAATTCLQHAHAHAHWREGTRLHCVPRKTCSRCRRAHVTNVDAGCVDAARLSQAGNRDAHMRRHTGEKPPL